LHGNRPANISKFGAAMQLKKQGEVLKLICKQEFCVKKIDTQSKDLKARGKM